jgi:hypothetical protein
VELNVDNKCKTPHHPKRSWKMRVLKKDNLPGCQWLMPVILATQEAKIKRITVQSQPRQIVFETLSQKNTSQKEAGGVAQMERALFQLSFWDSGVLSRQIFICK